MDLSWIAEFWAAYVPDWAAVLLGLASAIAFALVVHAIAYRVLDRVVLRRRTTTNAAAFAKRAKWPTRLILVTFAVTAVVPALPISADGALLLQRLVALALIALAGWLAISAVNLGGDIIARRYDITSADNLTARRVQTQLRILQRTINFVLIVITVSIMLMTIPGVREFGVSLFASAGVAGLAVGLAARPALSNLIAGLQIALAQPIRLDDVVIVEGEWGRVEEITATFVVVRIWDQRRLVVPLSHFIEKPFQNWTRQSAELIGTVFWYLDYSAPIDVMRAKVEEFARASTHWDGKLAMIQVTDTDRHTIEVRALLSAADSGASFGLRCEVREKMIAHLREHHPGCLPRVREEQWRHEDRGKANGEGARHDDAVSATGGER